MKRYQISKICDINSNCINSTNQPTIIEYLETGNITMNEIGDIQILRWENAPSRAQRKVKDKTILYSTVRPNLQHFGILSDPPENFIVSTGFITIDVKEKFKGEISPRFLYYTLTQEEVTNHLHRIAQNSVSSYPSINPIDIGNLSFLLPGYEYQCKASLILETIDKKIQTNKLIINEISKFTQDLYEYYFVQFEFPNENGEPYKTSGGGMQWNNQLKQYIPEAWCAQSLRNIANIVLKNISPMDNPDEVFEYYSIPAYDEYRYPLKVKGKSIGSNKYIIPERTILLSKLNPHFKRIWAPSRVSNTSVCSTEFMPFTSKLKSDYGYLYGILNSETFYTYMVQCSSSSTGSRKRMRPELCEDFTFAMPQDRTLIDTFNRIEESALNEQNQLMAENQELIAKRNTLLPLLLNGEVSIDE